MIPSKQIINSRLMFNCDVISTENSSMKSMQIIGLNVKFFHLLL